MAITEKIHSFLSDVILNSLTRKLVAVFLLFAVSQGLTLWAVYRPVAQGMAFASAAAGPLAGMSSPDFHHALTLSAILIVLFALALLLLRSLIVHPLREATEILSHAIAEEGDITGSIRKSANDEFGRLADSFNQFLGHLRKMFLGIHMTGAQIAVSAAKVTQKVGHSSQCAQKQGELADEIFAGSKEATAAQGEISNNTQQICASTSDNLDTARNSFQEMEALRSDIASMNGKISNYSAMISNIDAEAQEIKHIVTLIKSISFQTSLLALNAAIEAARAGQAGKGFSIVADEVKKLAEQVDAASESIEGKINSVVKRIEASMVESKDIARDAAATEGAVMKACRSFQAMVEEFEHNDAQLQSITASVEELSASSEAINAKVSSINGISRDVRGLIQDTGAFFQEMAASTEQIQDIAFRFKIGEGYLEKVIIKTKEFRDRTQEILETMLDSGLNIFDNNFQPIPGTDPPKYHTVYDRGFEEKLRPVFDQMLNGLEGCLYALALDANGYCPTHNSKYSRPLTGDYQTDLAASRDKRIYTDPIGLRAVQSTKKFLLQAYLRDTGEIMSEFSMPLVVGGRHWGGFRVGIDPAFLLQNKN